MTATLNPLWKAYNDAMNEGGEGFNPHEKFIGPAKGEPLWSKLGDKAYRLQNLMNATSDATPRWSELAAELAIVRTAEADAIARNI